MDLTTRVLVVDSCDMCYLVPPYDEPDRYRHVLTGVGVNLDKGQDYSYYMTQIRERC